MAGFQGVTEDLDVTTLGRGGSDTTAVAIAAAMNAARCEIYTDVDGIYTADPRLAPDARKLEEIGYQEMLELASYGAKMHPRSIELGMVYGVPIYVASSFNDTPGTLIHQGPDEYPVEDRIKVTGIACTTNVAKITVRGVPDRPGVAAALFEPLAEVGVNVDTIVQNASAERTTDISFHGQPDRFAGRAPPGRGHIGRGGSHHRAIRCIPGLGEHRWLGDAEHAGIRHPGCSALSPTAGSIST